MKIAAISDMHGNYDFEVPEADILCICGDIVPLGIQNNYTFSIEWFKSIFIPWCLKQPVDKVFFIGGNHDFFLEDMKRSEMDSILDEHGQNKIVYLENEATVYNHNGKDYKIYGTPLCHQFGPWAFMIPDDKMAEEFENIPEDVDILLSHDAPYGRNDMLLENAYFMSKGHIGNQPMANRLDKISPKVHFTGHLHSCNHTPVEYNGTTTVCVSMLDESYFLSYKPFMISID